MNGFVQKEYHLCNTNEWMRKLQTKIRHRSSTWKQQEAQLLCWMNFRWKTSKIVVNMKKRSTRESCMFTAAFHRYITFSIPVSGWRAASKKTREKQSEVQVNMPRSSSSSHGAFLKNLFRDKGRTNDLTIFEITWKWSGFRENHQHEKVSHFP